MPEIIKVRDEKTGKTFQVQYDGKPPTADELADIFEQKAGQSDIQSGLMSAYAPAPKTNVQQRTPKLPGVTFRDPKTKKPTGQLPARSVRQGDVRQVDRGDEAFVKSLSSMKAKTPEQIRQQDPNAPRFSNKSIGRDLQDMVGAEADALFMIPEAVRRRMGGDNKGAAKVVQKGLKSAGESLTGRAIGGVLGGSIQQGEGGAASRAFTQGALPGAGGLAGFAAGARVGGSVPAPAPVKALSGLVGGMVGAAGGGAVAAGAQRGLSRFLLGDEGMNALDQQTAIDQRDNPLAASIGQASTALLFGKPTANDIRAIPQIVQMVRGGIPLRVALASPAGQMLSDTLRERAMEAGVEVLAAAGENLITGKKMDWRDVGNQALSGALLPGENRLGRVFTGGGQRGAEALIRGVDNVEAGGRQFIADAKDPMGVKAQQAALAKSVMDAQARNAFTPLREATRAGKAPASPKSLTSKDAAIAPPAQAPPAPVATPKPKATPAPTPSPAIKDAYGKASDATLLQEFESTKDPQWKEAHAAVKYEMKRRGIAEPTQQPVLKNSPKEYDSYLQQALSENESSDNPIASDKFGAGLQSIIDRVNSKKPEVAASIAYTRGTAYGNQSLLALSKAIQDAHGFTVDETNIKNGDAVNPYDNAQGEAIKVISAEKAPGYLEGKNGATIRVMSPAIYDVEGLKKRAEVEFVDAPDLPHPDAQAPKPNAAPRPASSGLAYDSLASQPGPSLPDSKATMPQYQEAGAGQKLPVKKPSTTKVEAAPEKDSFASVREIVPDVVLRGLNTPEEMTESAFPKNPAMSDVQAIWEKYQGMGAPLRAELQAMRKTLGDDHPDTRMMSRALRYVDNVTTMSRNIAKSMKEGKPFGYPDSPLLDKDTATARAEEIRAAKEQKAPARANAPLMLPEAPPVAPDVLRGRLQEQQRQLAELLRTGTVTPAPAPAPVAPMVTESAAVTDLLRAISLESDDATKSDMLGFAARKAKDPATLEQIFNMTPQGIYEEQRIMREIYSKPNAPEALKQKARQREEAYWSNLSQSDAEWLKTLQPGDEYYELSPQAQAPRPRTETPQYDSLAAMQSASPDFAMPEYVGPSQRTAEVEIPEEPAQDAPESQWNDYYKRLDAWNKANPYVPSPSRPMGERVAERAAQRESEYRSAIKKIPIGAKRQAIDRLYWENEKLTNPLAGATYDEKLKLDSDTYKAFLAKATLAQKKALAWYAKVGEQAERNLIQGKPVPPQVLADYPHLVRKYNNQSSPAPTPQPRPRPTPSANTYDSLAAMQSASPDFAMPEYVGPSERTSAPKPAPVKPDGTLNSFRDGRYDIAPYSSKEGNIVKINLKGDNINKALVHDVAKSLGLRFVARESGYVIPSSKIARFRQDFDTAQMAALQKSRISATRRISSGGNIWKSDLREYPDLIQKYNRTPDFVEKYGSDVVASALRIAPTPQPRPRPTPSANTYDSLASQPAPSLPEPSAMAPRYQEAGMGRARAATPQAQKEPFSESIRNLVPDVVLRGLNTPEEMTGSAFPRNPSLADVQAIWEKYQGMGAPLRIELQTLRKTKGDTHPDTRMMSRALRYVDNVTTMSRNIAKSMREGKPFGYPDAPLLDKDTATARAEEIRAAKEQKAPGALIAPPAANDAVTSPTKEPWQMSRERENESYQPKDGNPFAEELAAARAESQRVKSQRNMLDRQGRLSSMKRSEVVGGSSTAKREALERITRTETIDKALAEAKAAEAKLAESARSYDEAPTPAPTPEPKPAPAPQSAPASNEPVTLASHAQFFRELRANGITPEGLLKQYERTLDSKAAIVAELNKKTVAELNRFVYARPGEKKADIIDRIFRGVLDSYTLDKTVSWQPFSETYEQASRRVLEGLTQADIDSYREKRKDALKAKEKEEADTASAIENPQTYEDFRTLLRLKGIASLTPEQKRTYEDLLAEKTKADRKAQTPTRPASPAPSGQSYAITEHFHSKRGANVYIAAPAGRMEEAEYKSELARAKALGGYYSRAWQGSPGGFAFKTNAEATAFVEGSPIAPKTEETSTEDGATSKNPISERMRATAERMEEAANESLNRDRKANTAKRASQAASAEASANYDLRVAKTMRTIADAIENGTVKYLDGVKSRAVIETLDQIVRSAKWDSGRKKGEKTDDIDGRTATIEDMDNAEYPYPGLRRGELKAAIAELSKSRVSKAKLATLGMASVEGEVVHPKKIVNLPVAEVITYTLTRENRAALGYPQGIPDTVYVYKIKPNTQPGLAAGEGGFVYTTMTEPILGKLSVSPTLEEAAVGGVRYGERYYTAADADVDKWISIKNASDIALLQTVNRLPDWQVDRFKRLQAADIKTPAELKAALREYLGLVAPAPASDPIKKAERELIGRKIPGYFPTPPALVEKMLGYADIQPGMSVLEPSAGKGNIADAIKEAHPDAQISAIEPVDTLRTILEAKGYELVDRDFLQHEGEYDRIVMNPPFEDGQDMAHVRHAYDLLKPGGTLVAITSEGPFFRSDKKAQEFRQWLEETGATDEKNPDKSFMDSERSTGVATRMVTIEKPASAPRNVRTADALKEEDAAPVQKTNESQLSQFDAIMKSLSSGETPAPTEQGNGKYAPALIKTLTETRQRLEAELADWSQRRYKDNSKTINLEGDGPTRNESIGIGTINQRRKAATIENLTESIDRISRIEKTLRTPGDSDTLIGQILQEWEDAGNADLVGKDTRESVFEYNINKDLLKIRRDKGSVVSTDASRAILAFVKEQAGSTATAPVQKTAESMQEGKADAPTNSPEKITGYTIEPYRYAKDSIVIRGESLQGFKNRADEIAEEMGARYVDRAKGYVMPASKEAAFRERMAQELKAVQEIQAQDKPTAPKSEISAPDIQKDENSFTPVPYDEVANMRYSEQIQRPEIKALISRIEADPLFAELKALADKDNKKRIDAGGYNAAIPDDAYAIVNTDKASDRLRNLSVADQKKADSLHSRILKNQGLRVGEPFAPFANFLIDGGPTKPTTKRDQLKAAQAQEAENLKSAVDKAASRLYSNPLPDPAIISAAGKWLAYEVAIRGIDTADAFRNQAEAIRTMADEFGDWVTLHQEKVLASAREFWQSDVVRTLKESKANIPTWIEGEEALGDADAEPEVHHSQTQERDDSGKFVASEVDEPEQELTDTEQKNQQKRLPVDFSAGDNEGSVPATAPAAPPPTEEPKASPKPAAPVNPDARKLLTIAVQQEIGDELGEDITSRDNLKRTWADTFVAASEDFDALRESATVKALSETPGTLSDEERVVAAQLQKTAREKVRELLDKGDLTPEEEGTLAAAIADAALYGRAIVQTGSELGRGLNFSKALMDDAPGGFMRDVERASTLAEGKLSQAQQRALLEVARQGERVQAEVALRLEERAQANIEAAQEMARAAVEEAKATKPEAQTESAAGVPVRRSRRVANPKSASYGRDNTVFTKDRYEAALAKLRKENNPTRRGATLNLGISAETVQALMDIGGFHFEAGLRQFSEWSKQVRSDVGDVAEAHLQSTWLQVKLDAAKEREGVKSIPAPTNFVEEVAKKLGKEKAFSFLEAITDEDGEPEILQKLIDGIDLNPAEAKQVRDAWAANAPKRGASAPPSDAMATVRTILEEVKPSRRFARQASASELEARQLAKESREARTAEARRQKYEAAQAAMQAAKFYRQEAAGAKRVEAAAQARAKRIEAQAEREAKAQVLAEEKRIEALGNAQKLAEARGQRVRRLREAKKAARALAQEQMQKTAGSRLEDSTDSRLGDMAQTGTAPTVRPRTTNPLIDQGVAEYAKGARSLEAFTRGLENRLGTELPEPLLRDLFKEAARRYSVEKGDVQKVKQDLTRKINAALLANRPPLYRLAMQVLQAKQKLIALKATFDVSFLGRQGGKIIAARPDLGIKALREGMQTLRNPAVALALDGEILADAEAYGGADHWKKIGLDFTLAFGEENTEAGKLDGPVWTWLKEHGIERSEEANRAILNRLRLDYFKRLAKPDDPIAYQKAMAALVNIMSSRSYMGEGETKRKVEGIVGIAHDYLQVWSPRNNLSNLQFLGGTAIVKPLVGAATMTESADRAASLKAAGRVSAEYARYAVTVGTTLAVLSGLAKAFGWDDWMQVETNPRSKDFGRVRVGRLELDLTSGWRKHWAFINEMLGARQESAFDIAAQGKSGSAEDWKEPDRGRVLDSYGRSMLNPLAGEALTQYKGRDFKGDAVKVYGLQDDASGKPRPFFDAKEAMVRGALLVGPISLTNWAEAIREQGSIPKETALWMAAAMPFEFIGVGTSVRDRRPETVSRQREMAAEKRKGFTPASEALRKMIAASPTKQGTGVKPEPQIVRNPVTGAYEYAK